jgi:HAD superfamily hydrolase (TIGR01457 family)
VGYTYIFDLDGVIYRGSEPQPEAKETVARLRSNGDLVFFLTNNSTQTRQQYSEKLSGMGIPTPPDDIMTSGCATALYLAESGGSGKRAYVVGEEGVREELKAVGIHVVEEEPADYVVVGLDRQFTYEKLLRAQQAILHGTQFIATNRDVTYPLEEGLVIPGGGSIVAAIEAASGTIPRVIGKPEIYSVRMILEKAGARTEDAVVVGDRLDTDILAGRRAGTQTVLVLSGVSTREDAESAPPEMHPDVIIERLGELLDASTHNCRV